MSYSKVVALIAALCVSVSILPAQTASPNPPKAKNKKEGDAINAMYTAQGPDAQLAAAQSLITSFADTEFKGSAFFVMAMASDAKRDQVNVMVYGEQAIAADPLNFGAMALMAKALGQSTKKYDLDKAEKTARLQKLAADAIELSKKAVKPNASVPDEQWAAVVKDMIEPAYEGLAYSAQADQKYAECAANFKLAIEAAQMPEPANMVYTARCYGKAKDYDGAIAMYDRAINDPRSMDVIKQIATQEKLQVLQTKGAK